MGSSEGPLVRLAGGDPRDAGDALGLNTGNSFRGERKVDAGYVEAIAPIAKNIANQKSHSQV